VTTQPDTARIIESAVHTQVPDAPADLFATPQSDYTKVLFANAVPLPRKDFS
jgi:hypothetical protein